MSNMTKFQDQKNDLNLLNSMAEIAVKSGKYPGFDHATVMNVFLTARALDVDPILALNSGFSVVKGKLNMGAHFMAALARRAGHSIKVIEMSEQKCVIIGKRKDNEDSLKYEMTWAEAQQAGLVNKQNWQTNPKQMLYCACIRNVFRILFSDIAIPYDADEMNVEGSLRQPDDVGLVQGAPTSMEISTIEAEDADPIEILKSALEHDGIPCERLNDWIAFMATKKGEAPEKIIEACLVKEILPKIKIAFAKWLSSQEPATA